MAVSETYKDFGLSVAWTSDSAGGYGFDFDSLPDGCPCCKWQKGDFSRSSSSTTAEECDLSEDDTCSTNASEVDRAGGYGFDFDSLPDGSCNWQGGDFSRSSSSTTAEEIEAWNVSCKSDGSSPGAQQLGDLHKFKEAAVDHTTGWGFHLEDLSPRPAGFNDPTRPESRPQILGTTATAVASSARLTSAALKHRGWWLKSSSTQVEMAAQLRLCAGGDALRTWRPLLSLPLQRRRFQARPDISSPGSPIAVVLNGSQGDLQPLVALAKSLEDFDHKVRIFTTCNLTSFCKDRGLDAVPVFADSQAVIRDMGGMVANMTEGMRKGYAQGEVWMAEHRSAIQDLEESLESFGPKALICGIQTMMVSFRYEKKSGVPVIPIYLSVDAYCNFRDYSLIEPARPAVISVSSFLDGRVPEETPPAHVLFTEEFVLDEAPREQDLVEGGRLAHLRRFLCSGPAPVAMGWGSMIAEGMKPSAMLGLALRSLKALGARGVVLGGFAALDQLAEELMQGRLPEIGPDADELAAFAAKDVCFVNFVSHEWLFPRCSVIVQHGGVGTWQAAIRAGKPTVITPIFADQFQHAANAENMGLGVGFKKKLPLIQPQELANAITVAEARTAAADAIGRKMRTKVGEREAAAAVDSYVRRSAGCFRAEQRQLRARQATRTRREPARRLGNHPPDS